jgi:hypothetical protein
VRGSPIFPRHARPPPGVGRFCAAHWRICNWGALGRAPLLCLQSTRRADSPAPAPLLPNPHLDLGLSATATRSAARSLRRGAACPPGSIGHRRFAGRPKSRTQSGRRRGPRRCSCGWPRDSKPGSPPPTTVAPIPNLSLVPIAGSASHRQLPLRHRLLRRFHLLRQHIGCSLCIRCIRVKFPSII